MATLTDLLSPSNFIFQEKKPSAFQSFLDSFDQQKVAAAPASSSPPGATATAADGSQTKKEDEEDDEDDEENQEQEIEKEEVEEMTQEVVFIDPLHNPAADPEEVAGNAIISNFLGGCLESEEESLFCGIILTNYCYFVTFLQPN